jgi:hypothetical protein
VRFEGGGEEGDLRVVCAISWRRRMITLQRIWEEICGGI